MHEPNTCKREPLSLNSPTSNQPPLKKPKHDTTIIGAPIPVFSFTNPPHKKTSRRRKSLLFPNQHQQQHGQHQQQHGQHQQQHGQHQQHSPVSQSSRHHTTQLPPLPEPSHFSFNNTNSSLALTLSDVPTQPMIQSFQSQCISTIEIKHHNTTTLRDRPNSKLTTPPTPPTPPTPTPKSLYSTPIKIKPNNPASQTQYSSLGKFAIPQLRHKSVNKTYINPDLLIPTRHTNQASTDSTQNLNTSSNDKPNTNIPSQTSSTSKSSDLSWDPQTMFNRNLPLNQGDQVHDPILISRFWLSYFKDAHVSEILRFTDAQGQEHWMYKIPEYISQNVPNLDVGTWGTLCYNGSIITPVDVDVIVDTMGLEEELTHHKEFPNGGWCFYNSTVKAAFQGRILDFLPHGNTKTPRMVVVIEFSTRYGYYHQEHLYWSQFPRGRPSMVALVHVFTIDDHTPILEDERSWHDHFSTVLQGFVWLPESEMIYNSISLSKRDPTRPYCTSSWHRHLLLTPRLDYSAQAWSIILSHDDADLLAYKMLYLHEVGLVLPQWMLDLVNDYQYSSPHQHTTLAPSSPPPQSILKNKQTNHSHNIRPSTCSKHVSFAINV
jgi:hypothetical protein